MVRNVALFDVVKAIKVAEQEALDSLGASSVVEARQKRREARRTRQTKRWDYVQRRANVAFSGTYRGPATEEELRESIVHPDAGNPTSPDHPGPKTASILYKLLKW